MSPLNSTENASQPSLLAGSTCSSRTCTAIKLSPEQKIAVESTVQATSAVIGVVGVSTAVALGAPAVMPMAFVLQKAVLFTNIGGVPASPVLAGVGEQMQWVQGRFGFFSSAGLRTPPSTGRRHLSPGPTRSDSATLTAATAARRAEHAAAAREALLTTITDFALLFALSTVGHLLLLHLWQRCSGQKRERRARTAQDEPVPTLLPDAAVLPPPAIESASYPTSNSMARRPARFCSKRTRRRETAREAREAKQLAKDRLATNGGVASSMAAAEAMASTATTNAIGPATLVKDLDNIVAPTANSGLSGNESAASAVTAAADANKRVAKAEGERLRAAAAAASVKPLPDVLVFPNLEVLVWIFFSNGITETSAMVLAAALEGVVYDGEIILIASLCLVAQILFYSMEGYHLMCYYRHCGPMLWQATPPVSSIDEVDDLLMHTVSSARLIKPTRRLRGVLQPDLDAQKEPHRTLRALHLARRPLRVWCQPKRLASDQHNRLVCAWLADVSYTGNGNGIFYHYVRALAALTSAFITGISSSSGGEASSLGSLHTAPLILIAVQLGIVLHCLATRAAGDRLEGLVSGIEAAACAIAVALLYASALSNSSSIEAATTDGAQESSSAASASEGFGSRGQLTAFIFTTVSIILPLCLNLYDNVVMAFLEAYMERDRKQGVCVFLRNMIVMPFTSLANFLDLGNGLGAVAEMWSDMTDSCFKFCRSQATRMSTRSFQRHRATLDSFQRHKVGKGAKSDSTLAPTKANSQIISLALPGPRINI